MRFFPTLSRRIGIFSVAATINKAIYFDFTDEEVMAREALVEHCHYRILVIGTAPKFDTSLAVVGENERL